MVVTSIMRPRLTGRLTYAGRSASGGHGLRKGGPVVLGSGVELRGFGNDRVDHARATIDAFLARVRS